ncbi:uncharacterized protein LOC119076798 [Bradysia coprophila]|uniref:uncharacterized protein LOC119076798 n=1 Tax=Bradysia coprophila TaxID=38358 RepID=UPI00187DBDBD|nr:uncharacterized protein LOC119076798 [Bradysia coprophila]
MAKLGLVFICVFLLVQWSLAARVVRDAPEAPVKAEGTEQNQFNLNEAINTFKEGIQKAFSKDNLDKMLENLGDAGDKLKEFGQNVINKAQETAADIANAANKKKEETSS